MLLSYATVNFYLFYDGAADMQTKAPLTRSHCRVSDTQVTVKNIGPLVVCVPNRIVSVNWGFFFVTTFYRITVSYLLNKLFPEN